MMVLRKSYGITIKYAVSASSKYFALLPDDSCVPLASLDELLYYLCNTTVEFNTNSKAYKLGISDCHKMI